MRNKIVKLLVVTILANLMLVNFVFAQTEAPATAPNPTVYKVTKADIDAVEAWVAAYKAAYAKDPNGAAGALASAKAACQQLSNNIYRATPYPGIGSYLAEWTQEMPGKCVFKRVYQMTEDGTAPLYGENDVTAVALWNSFRNNETREIAGFYKVAAQTDALRKAQLDSKNNAGAISAVIGWVLDSVLSIIAVVLGQLTALAGGILYYASNEALKVDSMPNVVNIGWGIIRDICNMFFILILIVIALSTILRVKEYSEYGHLLAKLVLMAILVNFSKVIAESLMSMVNLVAVMFQPEGIGQIYSTLMKIASPETAASIAVSGGWRAAVTEGLAKNLYMVVGFVVFLALACMFVIRLVGLYVLIIFSPIAYVARILPATEKFSEEWWSFFLKYLIWAPVAMFMLKLNIYIVNDPTFIPSESSFTFIILTGFLVAALYVAEEAGMVGSKIIMNGVHAAQHSVTHGLQVVGGAVGGAPVGYAGRKWNDYTAHMYAKNPNSLARKAAFAVLNPVAAGKAWSERSHEKTHIAQSYALATGKEIFAGKAGTPYRTNLARKEEMEYAKEYLNMTKEQKAFAAQQLENVNTHEGMVRKRALVRAAAEDNHIEDIMASGHFVERYTDAEGKINRESINRFVHEFLGAGHDGEDAIHNDKESERFIASDLNNIGTKTRRFDYTGHGTINMESGEYKRGFKKTGATVENIYGEKFAELEDDGQAGYAATEFGKLDGQDRIKVSPQNFVTIQTGIDENGNVTQNFVYTSDDYSRGMLEKMDEGSRRDLHRAQGRTIEAFIPAVDKDGSIVVKSIEEMKAVKDFYNDNKDHAKALYARKLGVDDPQKQVGKIHGIRIKLEGGVAKIKDPDGTTHVMKVADEILDKPGDTQFDSEHKTLTDLTKKP